MEGAEHRPRVDTLHWAAGSTLGCIVLALGTRIERGHDHPSAAQSLSPERTDAHRFQAPALERVPGRPDQDGRLAPSPIGGPVGQDPGDLGQLSQVEDPPGCPLHDEAVHDGIGSTDDHESFRCVTKHRVPADLRAYMKSAPRFQQAGSGVDAATLIDWQLEVLDGVPESKSFATR